MVRLRDVPRTATFAWSPFTTAPLLATGTKAGAVDADFSSDSQLELWDLGLEGSSTSTEPKPIGQVSTESRFHDIAWVSHQDDHAKGIIAGALENGSLDLWDAEKLVQNTDALISQSTKHSGAIKSLQFNPFRHELLATAGQKGELFISDLNNLSNPFRLGNVAARADDFECLDWNKKVPHILVTGSSGGFVTVWDVKSKKESLTLNNMGRKAVGAIAWDPDKPTRLITAVPLDTDPLIMVWDLRNSNAPERVLRGHDGGVLSLSWCLQDNDLLLSCGKDNRTICWNPQTGQALGEFPVVTNWTFQTRWDPTNPGVLATASFDGKIAIQTVQNTKVEIAQPNGSQALDGEDFFNKAQTQPQVSSFSLPKAPKWLARPCGASFGFGGKLISFGTQSQPTTDSKRSIIRIDEFSPDKEIGSVTEAFAEAVRSKDLAGVCEEHISNARSEADKKDWKVIETLMSDNPRKKLIRYLGFDDADIKKASTGVNGHSSQPSIMSDSSFSKEDRAAKEGRLSAFFDSTPDDDNFLADLASTKGAKTNNPFHIYTDSQPESDKKIIQALVLGHFDRAIEQCLSEDRMSDAFMIAICGGKSSIEKVQKAYFKKQASGPKYLRLLASVVGHNLWDIVYNADVHDWKEVMATLCTYASSEEFPDLCEALGDRLDEQTASDATSTGLKSSASFCYIAGSKLEKVIPVWIAELQQNERDQIAAGDQDSTFAVHARALQDFIEKVTIFREITRYQDPDRSSGASWKLAPLYEKYTEYAEIAAAHGKLQVAQTYLSLLPDRYPATDVARNRIQQATKKPAAQAASRSTVPGPSSTPRPMGGMPAFEEPRPPSTVPSGPYAPPAMQQHQSPYAPQGNIYGGGPSAPNMPPGRHIVPPPPSVVGPGPPRSMNASPAVPPPSRATNMSNWNDTPEDFFKPLVSRRGTPSAAPPPVAQVQQPSASGIPFPPAPHHMVPPQARPAPAPAPPPPKGPAPTPRQSMSHALSTPPILTTRERSTSSASATYTPPATSGLPAPQQPPLPTGPSAYNAPPSAAPPQSSRYAPTPAAQPPAAPAPQPKAPPPPNPFARRGSLSAPRGMPTTNGAPEIPAGPPAELLAAQRDSPVSLPKSKPASPRFPPGDRTQIPAASRPIFEILNSDMQRVKAVAPQNFRSHVLDAEKRLNILFDHLNNETLLKPNTVQDMLELSQALRDKDYDRAWGIHIDILTNRPDECTNWMTGVKRLINMSKATP